MNGKSIYLILAIFLVSLPTWADAYVIAWVFSIVVLCGLAYSWNIISGFTGYVSFGQIAFFGIGAYFSGWFTNRYGIPWPFVILIAGICAGAVAWPVGQLMLRLRGPFFAIGMLGFSRILDRLAYGMPAVTGGGDGLYLSRTYDAIHLYAAAVVVLLALIAGTMIVGTSRFGLKLLAIRDDEAAAEQMGIPTRRLKITAFVLSSFAPGMLGAIYTLHLSHIDPPTAFGLNMEVTTILATIVGGAGTVWGPLIGAIGFGVVGELLWARFPTVHMAVMGVALVLAMLWMPRGVSYALVTSKLLLPDRINLRRLVAREWAAQKLALGRSDGITRN